MACFKLEQFPILKKLDTDLKCEPFGNLEPHEKLELLQLLCDHLLVTQEYQDFVESLETNIQKLKTSIDHDLNVLATKLNLERSELMYNKREKHFRKIEESKLVCILPNYFTRPSLAIYRLIAIFNNFGHFVFCFCLKLARNDSSKKATQSNSVQNREKKSTLNFVIY